MVLAVGQVYAGPVGPVAALQLVLPPGRGTQYENGAQPSYRLRRVEDGYVIPALFGAPDLRVMSDETTESGAAPRGRWARS